MIRVKFVYDEKQYWDLMAERRIVMYDKENFYWLVQGDTATEKKEPPFRDDDSVRFIREVDHAEFVEGDWYSIVTPYNRTDMTALCGGTRYALTVIDNSRYGRYTSYDGYARLDDTDFEICNLEADENVRTGTAVWSQKNADFTDMLLDAAYWAYCCRCVDAVIFNLDFMPEVNRPETDGAYAAIHIKDGQLEVVRGRALEKLYHRYCRYPAMDYDIEEIISDIRGFYFRFERGWDNE